MQKRAVHLFHLIYTRIVQVSTIAAQRLLTPYLPYSSVTPYLPYSSVAPYLPYSSVSQEMILEHVQFPVVSS